LSPLTQSVYLNVLTFFQPVLGVSSEFSDTPNNWLHADSEVELTEDWGRYVAIGRIVIDLLFSLIFFLSGKKLLFDLLSRCLLYANCTFVYGSNRQNTHLIRPRLAIVTSNSVTVFLLLQPLKALCAHLETVRRTEHQQSCLNADLQFKFSELNNASTLPWRLRSWIQTLAFTRLAILLEE
jgi:hypothetical protein